MNLIHRWACRSESWRTRLKTCIVPWVLEGVDLGQEVLEVGPGPGLTTDLLRPRLERLTAIEIDPKLATALKQRMNGGNVRVVEGDATALPFSAGSFSGAVSFTMLHHVPSPALQDRLLAEICRVLKPGGVFAGVDSLWSIRMWLFHIADTLVAVNPDAFGMRLEAAGFTSISIDRDQRAFRFRARRPAG